MKLHCTPVMAALSALLLAGNVSRAVSPAASGRIPSLTTDTLPDGNDALIASLIARAAESRLSLGYSFTYTAEDGGIPLKFSGTLLVQQDKYKASGNGIEVYCDGSTRWVVDRESMEVYVQPAESIAQLFGYGSSLSELSISSLKQSPLSDDISPFVFDTSGLSGDWVVTDLR